MYLDDSRPSFWERWGWLLKSVLIAFIVLGLGSLFARLVLAGDGTTPPKEIVLAGYSLPVIISGILFFFYKYINISKRWQHILPLLIGAALGIFALFYNGDPTTFRGIADAIFGGIRSGLAAMGVWEGYKGITNKIKKPGVT